MSFVDLDDSAGSLKSKTKISRLKSISLSVSYECTLRFFRPHDSMFSRPTPHTTWRERERGRKWVLLKCGITGHCVKIASLLACNSWLNAHIDARAGDSSSRGCCKKRTTQYCAMQRQVREERWYFPPITGIRKSNTHCHTWREEKRRWEKMLHLSITVCKIQGEKQWIVLVELWVKMPLVKW